MYELQRGRNKRSFVYQQIADKIEQMIRAKEYQVGDKLPSIDDFTEKFNVNKLTVVKSLKLLTEKGIINTIPIRGTFVAATPENKHEINCIAVISMVMLPGSSGYYHNLMLTALQKKLSQQNITMIQMPSALQTPEQILMQAKNSPADAFIVIGWASAELLKLLQKEFLTRCVILDYSDYDFNFDSVTQDNENGIYQALMRLAPKNKKSDIAIICGPGDQPVSAERFRGIQKAKERNPYLKTYEFQGNFSLESGRVAMRMILNENRRFDGIFCMNDEMALGALSLINEQKIRIPDELWLFGYDDILPACAVNLSTIHSPVDEMVSSAVELLLRRIQNPDAPKLTLSFEPKIVWRETATEISRDTEDFS